MPIWAKLKCVANTHKHVFIHFLFEPELKLHLIQNYVQKSLLKCFKNIGCSLSALQSDIQENILETFIIQMFETNAFFSANFILLPNTCLSI